MSDIRFNRWLHNSGTGGVFQDSAGNVGIGSSVPQTTLDLGSGNITSHNINSTGIITATGFSGNVTGTVNSTGVITATSFSGNLTGNVTSSSTSTFSNGLNVTGGSVGIGTDNPSKPLQVHSDSSSAVLITGATPQIRFNSNVGDGSDNDRVILGRASGNDQFISGSVDGDAILRSATSKKVMIGYGTTEIAQFNSSGLKFKSSGMGIDFSANSNAAGMTSELLDDYEEGTFTPSFTGGTSGSGYTRQVGEYTKVGRLVTFTLTIDGDGGLTGTATAIEIGGLPFTSRNVPENGGAQYTYPGNFDTTNDRRFWLVAQNNTTLSYRSATAANINGNLVTNVNSQFVLYGHYFTDS
jgi:hypothetical protein